ncbi:uncharacterized protein LOC110836384 isoform X1 [Zootermopsis nevadensis]|uniref:uncharacterized protein LOC110836384 isoform X1 n=2 Tax=Zootermopsis nevadensis TaxID=136037 RepID=UPI000B8EE1A9|nr:uncharacterized protein LOC110836384 isoform X1 [Zootermopsis nevadensis]XP_021933203.1 uncharacterized protein LOC110836384 isoform X1 [Zootermopsis nevadensis]XP_021933204.1 uncharacterized protein LOC110836384 isoform X1 [Zootermopsis nevadensis]
MIDIAHEDDVPRFMLEAVPNLPLLPDDVLLYIMKYLGPVELHNLGKVTDRLGHLTADKNLWKMVDFRPHKLTSSELLKYVNYFKKSTKYLAMRGFRSEAPDPQWMEEVLTPELMKEICTRCPELETLILHEHFGVAFKLGLELFPETIRYLSMRDCVITDVNLHQSYFHKMHMTLPYIKVLILSNCLWVSPHDFMAISKCYHLEELRLDGCPQLGECVQYTSLAARFGFHSLKILDLRNTRMGDSDVGCFNRSCNLTHLYLQCPSSDVDNLCCHPACLPDIFLDSSDDDETSPFMTKNRLPVCVSQSLPALPARHLKKSHQFGSTSLFELRTDPYRAAPSTSHPEGDENGDPNLPQASTSYTVSYPRTPFLTSRKLESCKKHSSGDSDSSSDENVYSSVSCPVSGNELHEQTWTFEEGTLLPTNQVSCTGTSVSEAGSRGRKRRHSSGDHNSVPNEPCASTHSFVTSESDNSLKVRNFVSVSSNTCSMTDKSSKLQGDSLCQKLKTISGSSSANLKVNCFQESDVSKENDTERGRSSKADLSVYAPFYMKPSWCKLHRVPRCNKYMGLRLFHHPHLEPSNNSTISDMCIMSFVLKDGETDGAGYVRIISPQVASTKPPELHTLVVKDYKMITDASLTYLLKLKSLRYLDISGTSVTEVGVLQFRLKRPDVEVISDYRGLPI